MKRSMAILSAVGPGIAPAAADIPVIDKTNYAVARDTAEKTARSRHEQGNSHHRRGDPGRR